MGLCHWQCKYEKGLLTRYRSHCCLLVLQEVQPAPSEEPPAAETMEEPHPPPGKAAASSGKTGSLFDSDGDEDDLFFTPSKSVPAKPPTPKKVMSQAEKEALR